MLENVKRFDMKRKPLRQMLRPIIWLIAYPTVWKHKNVLKKYNMEGIKPPYLLLCNHNAFMDFSVATKAVFPHRANYVVAIDGYLKREWLLRAVGCICKRKFTSDTILVRQLKRVIDNGDIAAIYPEARYSLCGTTAVLPDSLGKLAKFLKVPVVTLMCHGNHINSPFWNLTDRKVAPTEAEMTCIFNAEELKEASVDEVNARIREAFLYDEYSWQKEKGIRVTYAKRAEGLHKVLYQCPHCGKEYSMATKDDEIYCTSCGKRWKYSELGELSAVDGETEFSHIPDWYEWERQNVRKEVAEGKYSFESEALVYGLPNAKGYINMGPAVLKHNMDGFEVKGNYGGEDYEMKIAAKDLYSVHIEYEYLGRYGDCVDLNTLNDTLYVYPKNCDFAVTKFALATEELYDYWNKKKSDEVSAEAVSKTDEKPADPSQE